jgi:large subunit ribosomal protein L31e
MAKTKPTEPKIVLERYYIVPLRRKWLKVPEYKRANKAVKALKQFMVKHMKIYDRDLRKIKVDIDLNNEIRFRGIKNPPSRIKVKAVKYDNDIVKVELVDIPENIKFKRIREEKKESALSKKTKEKEEEKKIISTEEASKKSSDTVDEEKEIDKKEKEEASKEEQILNSKQQAKESKHISQDKKVGIHRTILGR